MSNNLIKEQSPYLLQHMKNPVDWHPWSDETLMLAKNNNVPILLSIGYSSCHWCHVMARESFENNEIAKYMNENFINIKVDREERPDIDALYQSVLSLMGQQGGWPLTMFLKPDLKPFWGGTYFPDKSRYGMPGFLDVLKNISKIYKENNNQIIHNSNIIHETLKKLFYENTETTFSYQDISLCNEKIGLMFDKEYGGLSGSPKFPMVPLLKSTLLINSKNNKLSESSLKNIEHTALSFCLGGIYDHLEGGFSRYSVDERWLVPHFEKMLYDNAQIIDLLSALFSINPKVVFEKRVEKTFDWLNLKMVNLVGKNMRCYFSAIDADSSGGEGEYYVWKYEEIESILKEDFLNFSEEYGVSKAGNWENGKNILNRINKNHYGDFSYEFSSKNKKLLSKLLDSRGHRKPPFVDYKILTDWNSMLACGLVNAFFVFEKKEYLTCAKEIFNFIINYHITNDGIFHSSCKGRLGAKGTLDDYANFIKLCFSLHLATQEDRFLLIAKKYLLVALDFFYDKEISDFYYCNKNSSDLFVKTKSIMDTATQSSSSIMVENLLKAYDCFGEKNYIEMAQNILKNNWARVLTSPVSHASYLSSAYQLLSSYHIYVLLKKDTFGSRARNFLLKHNSIFMLCFIKDKGVIPKNSPAFGKKSVNGKTTIYICSGFACSSPISNIESLKEWFEKNTFIKKTKKDYGN